MLSHRVLSQCDLAMQWVLVFSFIMIWDTFVNDFFSQTKYLFSQERRLFFCSYAWKKNEWIDLCERKKGGKEEKRKESKQAGKEDKEERKQRRKETREGGRKKENKEFSLLLLFYWNVKGTFNPQSAEDESASSEWTSGNSKKAQSSESSHRISWLWHPISPWIWPPLPPWSTATLSSVSQLRDWKSNG